MVEIQMLQNVKIYIDLAQISTIDNTNENASPFSYFTRKIFDENIFHKLLMGW